MHTTRNKAPSTEHWGTPAKTVNQFEDFPIHSALKRCLRLSSTGIWDLEIWDQGPNELHLLGPRSQTSRSQIPVLDNVHVRNLE